MIGGLRDLGKTVFLTTHYMDEAQALADRVAILAAGRIVAEGPPNQLVDRDRRATRITFRLPPGVAGDQLPATARAAARIEGPDVSISAEDPVPLLRELTAWAEGPDAGLPGLEVRRASLEDVYLDLIDVDGVAGVGGEEA